MRQFLAAFMLVVFFFFMIPSSLVGEESKEDLQNKIREYENKLADLRTQKNSLSSQIQLMDTQIYLTSLKIEETEQEITKTQTEIEQLTGRIEGLDQSLNYLSRLLIKRVVDGYKQKEPTFIDLILDSNNADDLINRTKYVKVAQRNNQKIIVQVQTAKLNFEEQKKLREEKKQELADLEQKLVSQRSNLSNQKTQKQILLSQTQYDEKNYQALLARARAEYAAIQGIIAGVGTETLLREVKKGEVIASVIGGASCNSSGTHLHFTVLEGGGVINPFNRLKDVSHIDYTGGDPWSPSGDWDWPISPTIEFNQGYGVTTCVTSGWCSNIYSAHNGLDISGPSSEVYAVADGTLYRGSYSVGCTLPYVRVKHKDSNIETLYLHTYSQ